MSVRKSEMRAMKMKKESNFLCEMKMRMFYETRMKFFLTKRNVNENFFMNQNENENVSKEDIKK